MTLFRVLSEILFPPSCASCGEVGREPFCRPCAWALQRSAMPCLAGVTQVASLYIYGGPAEDAVHALKYRDRPDLGRVLGRLMQVELVRRGWKNAIDVAVPIPTSVHRLRARGYNPSRELCRGLDMPVVAQALVQMADRPQVGLDRRGRLDNSRMGPGPKGSRVAGRRVVLVDDVITTGATMETAAAVLRGLGVREIFGLSFARAAPPEGFATFSEVFVPTETEA